VELGIFVFTTIRRNDKRVDPRTLLVPEMGYVPTKMTTMIPGIINIELLMPSWYGPFGSLNSTILTTGRQQKLSHKHASMRKHMSSAY